jgi:predicted cobalt transporter CbtA
MNIASIGIDLGKTTFHLVALGERNKILLRRKFSRSQLLAYTANLPVSLIGLEACAGAHFMGAVPGERFSTKRPDTVTQTVPSPNFKPLAVWRRNIHLSVMHKILLRRKFSRSQLLAYTANLPVSLVGLEACAGAHFMGAVPGERFSTKRPDTFTQTVPSPNFKPLAVWRRTIHLSVMPCGC